MIKNKSRKRWFGASDTSYIMGNWDTDTFRHWWLVKLGLAEQTVETKHMRAGTAYEHKILAYIEAPITDRQIRIKYLRLRVNLDGEDNKTIYEVKTHQKAPFKVSRAYWQQAQVEMYAARKELKIVAYHMDDENYINYFLPIEGGRVTFHSVAYNRAWIEIDYLPRLTYLAKCLKKGEMPNARDFASFAGRLPKSKAYRFYRCIDRLLGRI